MLSGYLSMLCKSGPILQIDKDKNSSGKIVLTEALLPVKTACFCSSTLLFTNRKHFTHHTRIKHHNLYRDFPFVFAVVPFVHQLDERFAVLEIITSSSFRSLQEAVKLNTHQNLQLQK